MKDNKGGIRTLSLVSLADQTRENNRNKAIAAKKARRAAAAESGALDGPTRWQQLLDGTLTIQDLDNEELRRKQTRDRIGEFGGGKPAWPRKLEQARTAELLRRGQDIATSHVPMIFQALTDIVNGKDPFATTADRIRAATIMIERGAGKVPDHIVHHSANPWDDILEGVIYEETHGRAQADSPQRS